MSIKELKIFLINNDLQAQEFATLVGVNRQTVYNWTNGLVKIPSWVDDFCKDYENKCS